MTTKDSESSVEARIAAKPETKERYRALGRLTKAVRSLNDCERFLDIIARDMRAVVHFDVIAQFHDGAVRVDWRFADGLGLQSPQDEASILRVFEHGQSHIIPNLNESTRFPEMSLLLRDWGLQSACVLPLAGPHRGFGSLLLASMRPDLYNDEEVEFLSFAASEIALALEDCLNFQSAQRLEKRLSLLLDLTNRFVSNLDLQDVLREASTGVRRVLECDGVGVNLPIPEEGRMRIYALDLPGRKGTLHEELIVPIDDSPLIHEVLAGGKPIYASGDEYSAKAPRGVAEGFRCAFFIPIITRGSVLGVLIVGRRQERGFSNEDVEFLTNVAGQMAIAIENAQAYRRISDLNAQLAQEKLYLQDEIRSEMNFDEIVGKTAVLRDVLHQVEIVAPTDSTVLIYGETGTGKELIARAVHNLSTRNAKAFVKLNCAAIPTGLLESELFGHEKGAFTGAIAQRLGRFELAHGGSVFLDEIGEIPLELQPKLLRVLQEGEFERLGGSRTLRSDARLIAATNRDLEMMVTDQKFRSDLYYRLNVFPVRLPALRERPDDIPLLVRHFVHQFSRRMGKSIETIPSDTMTLLTRYQWPGNIRELQNVIERAVILSGGSVLNVPVADLKVGSSAAAPATIGHKLMRTVDDAAERKEILAALERSNWVVAGPGGAAAMLGIKRSTLQARMQKLGIQVSRSAKSQLR